MHITSICFYIGHKNNNNNQQIHSLFYFIPFFHYTSFTSKFFILHYKQTNKHLHTNIFTCNRKTILYEIKNKIC